MSDAGTVNVSARPRRPALDEQLRHRFGSIVNRRTDGAKEGSPSILTVPREHVLPVLAFLARDADPRAATLWDITVVDHGAGRDVPRFEVLYSVRDATGAALAVSVFIAADDLALPSCVDLWPSAEWLELEAEDFFGLEFDGHPHTHRLFLPDDYPAFPLRREIPLAGVSRERAPLASPPRAGRGRFRMDGVGDAPVVGPSIEWTSQGERVAEVDVAIGRSHLGFEKRFEGLGAEECVELARHIDRRATVHVAWAVALAFEQAFDLAVDTRGETLRVIAGELERIAAHLACVRETFLAIGCERLAGSATRLLASAETALASAAITVEFGNAREAAGSALTEALGLVFARLPRGLTDFRQNFARDRFAALRLRGIGVTRGGSAGTGPTARAAGIARDVRRDAPYGRYDALEFDVPVGNGGDALARLQLRLDETVESLRVLARERDELERLGPSDEPKTVASEPSNRYAHARVEAPDGEITATLVLEKDGTPLRLGLRSASFQHTAALPNILRAESVEDVAAIGASLGIHSGLVDR